MEINSFEEFNFVSGGNKLEALTGKTLYELADMYKKGLIKIAHEPLFKVGDSFKFGNIKKCVSEYTIELYHPIGTIKSFEYIPTSNSYMYFIEFAFGITVYYKEDNLRKVEQIN